MTESTEKHPIINCHIHTFTGDYVPPYLAKTSLPWPFYYLFSLKFIIKIIRWYFNKIKPLKYKNTYKWIKRQLYLCEMFFRRIYILWLLKFIVETYLFLTLVFYIGSWFIELEREYEGLLKRMIQKLLVFLRDLNIILEVGSLLNKILFLIVVLILFKSIRNIVLALLKQFKILPGKETMALFSRYVQIGMFSKYKLQSGIYNKLKNQYPPGTHFACLPMDMEQMAAGKLSAGFTIKTQMEGLLEIKNKNPNTFHPFVFADPRRMAKDKNYFDYYVDKNNQVQLIDGCIMKNYLEHKDHKFAGIKIYPALGYYPFEEVLLPLWKYAQQKNLPIMTHCIKGTIFYRGKKKVLWDKHPIFTEGKIKYKERIDIDFDLESDYIDHDEEKSLYLNEVRNIDFCNNFTNPLNYLCLLDKLLLTKVVGQAVDERIKQIFGYDETNKTIAHGLEDLKLCFAHFGGDDQWYRFLESDRDNFTSQLILNPDEGIDFFKNTNGVEKPGKLAYIWKYVDWYTIICSIMLQYDNVYADISYILHDDIILPLLKQTLSNKELNKKVLYGSDFYVVRNHKSDKEILADIKAGLTKNEFDQIARVNPRSYLNLD